MRILELMAPSRQVTGKCNGIPGVGILPESVLEDSVRDLGNCTLHCSLSPTDSFEFRNPEGYKVRGHQQAVGKLHLKSHSKLRINMKNEAPQPMCEKRGNESL